MNADGSGQRQLTHLPAYNGFAAWLPDGKITFVSSHGPNDFEIYVDQRRRERAAEPVTRVGTRQHLSSLEPGRAEDRLREQARWQLGALRDERRRKRAAEPDAQRGERLPLWRSIPGRPTGGSSSLDATATATAAATHIYVINADGSGERYLTRGRKPRWSPDGQKITFTSKRENWAEIYVMNADGSGQQRLTRSPARTVNARTVNDPPVWSPAQK